MDSHLSAEIRALDAEAGSLMEAARVHLSRSRGEVLRRIAASPVRCDAFGSPIDNCKCGDILPGRKFAAGEQPFFRRRPMTLRSLQTTCSHMLI
jgi:hypothetical protein